MKSVWVECRKALWAGGSDQALSDGFRLPVMLRSNKITGAKRDNAADVIGYQRVIPLADCHEINGLPRVVA
ncbi:hypothetical protein DDE20_11130 [Pararhodobacter oceanensis]|uniref:Uncharacterized protein n=1 Tax=Pararhodobacter oceanensis TaxID=2172121 RepID=A0A2T8HTJ3_9RHOB|nr:hypothetical protein DDE20_11130 [Pararhodobacter oceanensis]